MEEYNTIEKAQNYTNWRTQSFYLRVIEKPNIFKLVGDLSNKTLIDYGCGAGFYTNLFAERAYKVIGVDSSQSMIDVANKLNKLPNIEYYVQDCTHLFNLGTFDMATSIFVLNHAPTTEVLKKFLSSMYNSLKPGGICCGETYNIFLKPDEYHYLRKYNVSMKAKDPSFKTSNEVVVEFLDEKGNVLSTVIDHQIAPNLIENTFKEVGFINFKWIKLTLDDEYNEYKEFLSDYLNHQSSIMYYAVKP